MKTPQHYSRLIVLFLGTLTLLVAPAGRAQTNSPTNGPAVKPPVAAPAAIQAAPAQPAPAQGQSAAPSPSAAASPAGPTPAAAGPATGPGHGPAVAPVQPAATLSNGEQGLRLNFRGVPLEMVLNYLSDAAGFTILIATQAPVQGTVNVWSDRPLSKDQAVNLLNSILNKNGYAAIRNGQTLTITTLQDAKKHDIPVNVGSEPSRIPRTDEVVTQIIPVKHANATQLTKDLQPLLPEYAQLSANESANSLVLTDTQADARRMAEIVKALDTSISTVSTVQVFPLRYADAKALADEIKTVFATPQQNNQAGNPGGRGPGRFFRMMRNAAQANSQNQGGPNVQVVAVADEASNAVVVSAPRDIMDTITALVNEIDKPNVDTTELRVFHLVHADPQEIADEITQLFPDSNSSNNNNQNRRFRFFRGPFGPPQAGSDTSDRMKKKSEVHVVPDPRTSSLIVSADASLMPSLAEMITQLDSDSTKKQRVFVYSLKNADPQQVQQVLEGMFERSNTSMNRQNANQTSPLTTRSQQYQQNGLGSSGFGSSRNNNSGLGGGGLGGGR
jgi:type II secretory pathway component GspD/PulD (secretin)